jgi:hypothetical protein
MLSSPSDLHPPNSIIPGLREAVSITTPLILSQNPSPKIKSKDHKLLDVTALQCLSLNGHLD